MVPLNILNYATIIPPVMLFGLPARKGTVGNTIEDRQAELFHLNASFSHFPIYHITLHQYKTLYNGFGKQWSARFLHFDTNTEQIRFQLISLHCSYPKSISRVITRLFLGHTRLTHKHLTNRQPQPLRRACNTPMTVPYLLVAWREFDDLRISLRNYCSSINKPLILSTLLASSNEYIIVRFIHFLNQTNLLDKLWLYKSVFSIGMS